MDIMLNASLRRSGGSLIMTIPQSYIEQNRLDAGSRVLVEINGSELKVRPGRERLKLSDLLAETPEGLCRATGWDEMPATGEEL
jgi:antitoxin ChpS